MMFGSTAFVAKITLAFLFGQGANVDAAEASRSASIGVVASEMRSHVIEATNLYVQTRYESAWDDSTPEIRAWFSSLKQPNLPDASCCGDADAYYADEYSVDAERKIVTATITNNRGHSIAKGTRIAFPLDKMNQDPNLTSHGLLFLGGTAAHPVVFCFLPFGNV